MAVGGRKHPLFTRSLEYGNDFLFEFACSPCNTDGKNKEAIKFCIDCGEYFCANCLNDHNRFAKMKSHQIVDPAKQQKTTTNPVTINAPKITICCEKHLGKFLDMFCADHDEICCAVCIALDHSLCKNRHYVPDIAKDFKKSGKFKQQQDDGQNTLSNLVSIIQKKQTDIALYKAQKDAIYDHFKQAREDLLKQFDGIEKRSVDLVEKRYQQNIAKATEDIKKTEMVYKTLKRKEDELKAETDDSQSFIVAKRTEKDRENAKETAKGMLTSKALSFDFRISDDVRNCLTSFESLGYFYKAKRYEVFSVQDKDEKYRCNITGLCQLQNGDLIAVDAANQSVKRLGATFIVNEKCRLPSQPWSVCNVSDEVIAVSLCNEKKIQFLSVNGKMKLSRSFYVKDMCTGIASLRDMLYVGLNNRRQIQVYDNSGYPDKIIDLNVGVPWHIAVSKDATSLYVASRKDGVFSVDMKSQKLAKIDVREVSVASGLALTTKGTLFVSCMQTNKIFKNTGLGYSTLLTKSDGVTVPQTIFYDQKQRLIVASENTDVIRVYPDVEE